jgi:general secretion pathway protein C
MSISRRLRGSFTLVLVGPLGVSAFLSGRGVGDLVAARFDPGVGELSLATTSRPRAPAPAFHETTAAAILARNPFDSRWRPVAESPEDDGAIEPAELPSCGDVRVLAIVASEDPDWSFAAVQVPGQRPLLRRRGGAIDRGTVEFIGRERVWMRREGRLCLTAMFAPPPVPVVDGGASQLQSAKPGTLESTLAKGIRRTGTTEFEIDRGVVDQVLEHQAELLGRTHVALEKENGRSAGVRLTGIQPGALLNLIGLENGDQVQTVNGFDVTNPTTALEAIARLQQAAQLTVVLRRAGVPMTLSYDVR